MGEIKHVTIDVYAEIINSQLQFRHASTGQVEVKPTKLTFKSPKNELFYMKFVLHDTTNLQLIFEQEATDAFWSRRKWCPKEDEEVHDGPFVPCSVSANRQELVVGNPNNRPKQYYYMLRFESNQGKKNWDPIIDNKNGGDPDLHIAIIIGLLATGGVVSTVLMALFGALAW